MVLELVDRREHTNMSWNGLSLDTRSEEKYAWGTNTTYDTKESGFTLSFQRGNGSGSEDQLFGSSSFSFSAFQTSGAGKSNFQLPGQGVGQHNSGGGLHESQDFHRALSSVNLFGFTWHQKQQSLG